jgi:hypothetical protein
MHRLITRLITAGTLCGVLDGCASTGTPSPDDNQPTDRIAAIGPSGSDSKGSPGGGSVGNDMDLVIHASDSYTGINARITASPSSVMETLENVYPDLGIPLGTLMTSTGQIGNRSYRVPGHRLKTIQLSRILDCGAGSLVGIPADVEQVTINVVSTIKAATDSGSVVNTYLSATARGYTSSNDAVHCSSNGMLERMINERLIKELARSSAH